MKTYDPKDGALPVHGYQPQTESAVMIVNGNKEIEETTLRVIDSLRAMPGIDQRWLAIGLTHIEQGWMAINRAVFKPKRFALPGDEEAYKAP